MIRISTAQIRLGDEVRTFDAEGTVIRYQRGMGRGYMELRIPTGEVVRSGMNDAGTVELLSSLKGRTPAQSFGRW